jgi:cysteinyl-tRNA synthetase
MHNGMVQLGDAKMAKSVGNIRLLHTALTQFGRDALIMYFCGGHYRQPLAFSADALEEADRRIYRVRDTLARLAPAPSPPDMRPLRDAFFDALADDFNTPRALSHLFDWIREANRRAESVGDADLREMLGVLGLERLAPLLAHGDVAKIDPKAAELAERRRRAREARDFAAADDLRDAIRALGWEVRDGPDGQELIPLVQDS